MSFLACSTERTPLFSFCSTQSDVHSLTQETKQLQTQPQLCVGGGRRAWKEEAMDVVQWNVGSFLRSLVSL